MKRLLDSPNIKIKIFTICSVLVSLASLFLTTSHAVADDNQYELVLKSQINWEQLNPARGDQSPKAGTLLGDRKSDTATGFILKPVDKFQSPPHIHNVTYRGVVISGLIHNDDPKAERMWMPAESFWTQPKGEAHITCATGIDTLAYIEIEEGPYLVMPEKEAFDSGERPVNVDKTNVVWIDSENSSWIKQSDSSKEKNSKSASISYLWGKPVINELNGSLLKIPSSFKGRIESYGKSLKAVVIKGNPLYKVPGQKDYVKIETASYFGSKNAAVHYISNPEKDDCILYIRSHGHYKIYQEK